MYHMSKSWLKKVHSVRKMGGVIIEIKINSIFFVLKVLCTECNTFNGKHVEGVKRNKNTHSVIDQI